MRWEYFRLSIDGPNIENSLQELGQNGWELVSVIPETRIFFGFQCFLKRPVNEGAGLVPERPTEPKRLEKFAPARSTMLGRSTREEATTNSLAGMGWKR